LAFGCHNSLHVRVRSALRHFCRAQHSKTNAEDNSAISDPSICPSTVQNWMKINQQGRGKT